MPDHCSGTFISQVINSGTLLLIFEIASPLLDWGASPKPLADWNLIRSHARLAQYFLKEAKANRTVGLAESTVAFFKASNGVLERKAFLPPKQARIRQVQAHGPWSKGQRKVKKKSKCAPAVSWLLAHAVTQTSDLLAHVVSTNGSCMFQNGSFFLHVLR